MQKKQDFSKKILSLLSSKQAMRVEDLKKETPNPYGATRSIKNLTEGGFIEKLGTTECSYARITQKGRQRLARLSLDQSTTLATISWDGKWRIILLDLPEERKAERESLRYLLKKAGFLCVKNAVWVSPFPFEFLFQNIKKDFNLTTELMIFVTDEVDEATREYFIKEMLA